MARNGHSGYGDKRHFRTRGGPGGSTRRLHHLYGVSLTFGISTFGSSCVFGISGMTAIFNPLIFNHWLSRLSYL